jgi:hypothetical protein
MVASGTAAGGWTIVLPSAVVVAGGGAAGAVAGGVSVAADSGGTRSVSPEPPSVAFGSGSGAMMVDRVEPVVEPSPSDG